MKDVLTVILNKVHLWILNKYITPEGVSAEGLYCATITNPNEAPIEVLEGMIGVSSSMSFAEAMEFAEIQALERQVMTGLTPTDEDADEIAKHWSTVSGHPEYYEHIFPAVKDLWEFLDEQ